jgi:hypothetical protein
MLKRTGIEPHTAYGQNQQNGRETSFRAAADISPATVSVLQTRRRRNGPSQSHELDRPASTSPSMKAITRSASTGSSSVAAVRRAHPRDSYGDRPPGDACTLPMY